MAKWFCCCGTPTTCLIGSDNFNRTSVGSGWYQSSGTWSISSNQLTTSDTNAYIRYETAHPGSVAEHVVQVDITFDTCGDKARIVLSDTLYAEVEWGPGLSTDPCGINCPSDIYGDFCGILRLINGSTTVAEQRFISMGTTVRLRAYYHSTDHTFAALLDANTAIAGDEDICVRVDSMSSYPTGTKVGLGTGDTNAGTILFDDFNYWRHYTTGWEQCPGPCTDNRTSDCAIQGSWFTDVKSSITSDDLNCDFTINAGTWDAVSTSNPTVTTASHLETASANAEIEYNTQEEAPADGYMVLYVDSLSFENEGDQAVFQIDYGAGGSHKAVITCGDATGDGGTVKLYKNGTLLQSFDVTWFRAGLLGCCDYFNRPLRIRTYPANDGSGLDVFCVGLGDCAYSPGTQQPGWFVSHTTTVNGNTGATFGTGSTVTGTVRFGATNWQHTQDKDDGTECNPCECITCEYCPAGVGPQTATVVISGVTGTESPNPYNKYGYDCCDCDDLNGTFVIAMDGLCYGSYKFFMCYAAISEDNPLWSLPIYACITVVITSTATGWRLTVKIMGDPNCTQGTCQPGTSNVCFGGFEATFIKDFPMTTPCTSLSNETIPFDHEDKIVGQPDDLIADCTMCDSFASVVVKVTTT